MNKMTVWGVGPRIMLPSYSVLIILSLLPAKVNISGLMNIPDLHIKAISLITISVGMMLLFIANAKISKALKTNQLITTGLFSIIRNPMYAAHIFFLMPGICLLTNNATTMLSIFFAIIIFNALIVKEENVLEQFFGLQYVEYKKTVNRLIPK